MSFDFMAIDDFVTETFDSTGVIKRYDANGELHNPYGPAVVMKEVEFWYKHGKLHREDGPAIVFSRGAEEWYYKGKYYGRSNTGYTQQKFERDYLKAIKREESK